MTCALTPVVWTDDNVMKWTKDIPAKEGWYWKRNTSDKYDEPEVVHVRNYAGELAIGNSFISGWNSLKRYEWAGPIPLPIETVTSKAEGVTK